MAYSHRAQLTPPGLATRYQETPYTMTNIGLRISLPLNSTPERVRNSYGGPGGGTSCFAVAKMVISSTP
jgi:hypothetical protein